MAAAMGAIGLGSSVAGGILGAVGARRTADANAQMYNYQAQVADINAQIAQQNADYAMQAGEKQSVALGIKQGQGQAKIRNAQAASGLDINSGSNAAVQEGQKKIDLMDAAQLRENTSRTAYGYEVQKTGYKNSAALARSSASNASVAGDINVMSSIIGSASSVSSKWQQGNQAGLFGSQSLGG